VSRILVTGSSGWLGRSLVPRLRAEGHSVVGIDVVPSATTDLVGSIVDRGFVREVMRDVTAVVHSAALHKPNIVTHSAAEFVDVNVTGTLNLLEEAVASGSVTRSFVFTSTTSLMISAKIRKGNAREAVWITEAMTPLLPRNIYGVTKLSAEHLCRLYHELHGLPVVVLRTSRFFPEEDDMAHAIAQTEPNTKANELLFRRLTVDDASEAHVAALRRAPELGFDVFIVSAPTPFAPADCRELVVDAPAVVRRYFPQYPEIYARLGWTMFDSIDRVYVASRATDRLGFTCRTSFAERLAELDGGAG
jgi:UDP-glucose 4-epimerase